MIPRSGGEKVYLEAAYRKPNLLITVVFAVQAIALGFIGEYPILLPRLGRHGHMELTHYDSLGLYRLRIKHRRRSWEKKPLNGGARD
jgi:hypothetical protein